MQGQWTSAKDLILVIIKRVFKKLKFEYVNLLCLALSRTFNLQIIKLFLNLHSIFYFLFFSRLLVRILNSSMPTIEMRSMLMNAKFNYLFELTHQWLFFFLIYCLQILSLQLSVVGLRLPLLMGFCMRGIMRHLVQPQIMWLTQKGGQLVMLDILVGPIMLSIQVLRYHNSQIL